MKSSSEWWRMSYAVPPFCRRSSIFLLPRVACALLPSFPPALFFSPRLGTWASLLIISLVTSACRLLLRPVHTFKHVHVHFPAVLPVSEGKGGSEEEVTPVTGFVFSRFPPLPCVTSCLSSRYLPCPSAPLPFLFYLFIYFEVGLPYFCLGELISPFCPPLLWSFMLRTVPPNKTLLQKHFFFFFFW